MRNPKRNNKADGTSRRSARTHEQADMPERRAIRMVPRSTGLGASRLEIERLVEKEIAKKFSELEQKIMASLQKKMRL